LIPHYVIQFVSDLRQIPHYVIQFVSELRQVGGFYSGTPVSSTNKFKTDCHDITEILLKVALNTITLLFTLVSKTERESVHSPWRQRSLPIYRYTCIQTCCCKWLKFFQLSNIRLDRSTRIKTTDLPQVTDKLYHIMWYPVPV
jgi:hypothetical protein